MVIVVIADDFSGAAELAGIGHRFGLNVEIQSELNTEGRLDMVVLNTNSRSMTEIEAVQRVEELSLDLIKTTAPIKIFKKIDSTMRGHILAELAVLQYHFEYDKILMIPANPSRNRIIENGQYYVDGVKLSESVFAQDPHYPATSSFIEDLVSAKNSDFEHQHLAAYSDLPTEGLITSDVSNTVDVKHFVDQLGEFDLCVGAADTFEAFLEFHGHQPNEEKESIDAPKKKIIINGSTVKFPDEHHHFLEHSYPFEVIPSTREGSTFTIQKANKQEKFGEFLEIVKSQDMVSLSIDHPIQSSKTASNLFQDWLKEQARYIVEGLPDENLYFGLTGGATTANILKALEIKTLKVVQEIFPGIVTLKAESHPRLLFTVKPGSYPWPDSFLKN